MPQGDIEAELKLNSPFQSGETQNAITFKEITNT